MVPEKLQQIVRQFSENGLKLLLENPPNVVDLLRLSVPDIVQMIEPDQLKTVQTTFVGSDCRHVESDIVLAAPLRRGKAKRLLRRLLIYILIEHQSQPDRLMPLHSLDYAVQHLETMPEAERLRWLELLSYIMALVYHARDPSEQPKLQQTIESSVRTDIHRQEIFEMRRTIADELEEKGALENRRQVLLRQLRRRFGNVPATVSATIRATDDPEQLDEWLDQVVTVETLDDIGIGAPV